MYSKWHKITTFLFQRSADYFKYKQDVKDALDAQCPALNIVVDKEDFDHDPGLWWDNSQARCRHSPPNVWSCTCYDSD